MKLTRERILQIIREEIQDSKSQALLQEEPSLNNALAGVRRDYNTAVQNNKIDSFVVKYSDGKTPYEFFNELEPEEQDKYKQDIEARLKKIEDSDPVEPEAPQDTETQPEEEPEVKTLSSGDKIVPQELPELRKAFAAFADIDSGFMQVQYLREQDKMIGNLRTALRKFLGLEGQEKALKEQDEENQKPQADKSDNRKKLVKSVTRYRRDLNDAGRLLDQYLKSSQAGELKAQLILNKLKDEMQKVQDNNALIVRDLMSISNLSESMVLEQESREEKIAKVQAAYDSIVTTLTPALQIQTKGDETIQQTDEEIQSIVNGAESALEQVDNIKQYFRVTGTFKKPLGELKTDFLEYIAGYKKTMSDLVVDLKGGTPTPEDATKYARQFTRLADKIQEDFGVSPSNPIKVPGLPPVQSVDAASGDNTVAINPSAPEVTPEFDDEEDVGAEEVPEPTTLLQAREDANNFVSRSSRFMNSFLNPFVRSFNNPKKTYGMLKTSVDIFKKQLNDDIQEQQQPSNELVKVVQDANKLEDTIKDYIRFVPAEEIATKKNKDDLLRVVRSYYKLVEKFREITDKELQDLIQGSSEEIEKLNKIALQRAGSLIKNVDRQVPDLSLKSKLLNSLGSWAYKLLGGKEMDVKPDFSKMGETKNILEKLIINELKVLNGKKMVRN